MHVHRERGYGATDVPRTPASSRTDLTPIASQLRARRAFLNGHYDPARVRARVEAAVSTGGPLNREEVIEAVTAVVLQKVLQ